MPLPYSLRGPRLLLHLPNILEEKHKLPERNESVTPTRIIPRLLSEDRVAGVHLPEMFDPGRSVALRQELLNFSAIGAMEGVRRRAVRRRVVR
ncbi:hypothetical protein [Dyadobacter pollutisoli]|uniref:hypothetical protein n=1 Tax=Dyadobacter pollutisoli TaxID=2910158 RepID=UPI001FCFA7B8|nr:hypothetical protein [Dyadobacter pollutisoli]